MNVDVSTDTPVRGETEAAAVEGTYAARLVSDGSIGFLVITSAMNQNSPAKPPISEMNEINREVTVHPCGTG